MEFLPVKPYEIELIEGSLVEATLIITKADFENVAYQDDRITLSFFNYRFTKLVIENVEEIAFQHISIGFYNCFIHELVVEKITSENISIGFYSCVVQGKIESKNLLSVTANNCLLSSSLFIIDVGSVDIRFTKENIGLKNWKALFLKYNISNYSNLISQTHKYHILNVKRLLCTSNQIEQDKRSRFKTSLNITYENQSADTDTKVSNLQLESLAISGSPIGTISIENTKVNAWYLYDFYPKGEVSFYNINPISESDKELKIGIHRSILDNVEFDNISFDKYPIISFYRTKFSGAVFTSCDFPVDYKTFSRLVPIDNVHYPEKKQKNYDKAQYEIFLQLKKAFEDTGNYYEAQKLQAISHEALIRIKGVSRWDRTILNINSWSNDHGLSIKLPFLGFFMFSIPLYILYLLSIGRIFNCNQFDANLIGYFFSFVDITHRSDFLASKDELTGWSLFLDYMAKVVVGFFIYQFIAAFRKYGRK